MPEPFRGEGIPVSPMSRHDAERLALQCASSSGQDSDAVTVPEWAIQAILAASAGVATHLDASAVAAGPPGADSDLAPTVAHGRDDQAMPLDLEI
jgi:hypothetical protein